MLSQCCVQEVLVDVAARIPAAANISADEADPEVSGRLAVEVEVQMQVQVQV
jgi:hypothetical protein